MLAKEKKVVYVDPERCTGCRSCEMACAIDHSASKNLFEAIFEKPVPKPRLKVVAVESFSVPVRCQHCEDAPCLEVCPTGAIFKSEEGFVLLNQSKCIGCMMCVMVCPFGHPKYESEYKSVLKCGFCAERVRRGMKPACVEACPTNALRFGTLDEILDEVRKDTAEKLILGQKVEGLVYTKGITEKRKESESVLAEMRRSYSGVSWY